MFIPARLFAETAAVRAGWASASGPPAAAAADAAAADAAAADDRWTRRSRLPAVALTVVLGCFAAPRSAAAADEPGHLAAAPARDFSAWIDPAGPADAHAPADADHELNFDVREAHQIVPLRLPPAALWNDPDFANVTAPVIAPLPPAIVAGPAGIAAASLLAWRANRRGGRL